MLNTVSCKTLITTRTSGDADNIRREAVIKFWNDGKYMIPTRRQAEVAKLCAGKLSKDQQKQLDADLEDEFLKNIWLTTSNTAIQFSAAIAFFYAWGQQRYTGNKTPQNELSFIKTGLRRFIFTLKNIVLNRMFSNVASDVKSHGFIERDLAVWCACGKSKEADVIAAWNEMLAAFDVELVIIDNNSLGDDKYEIKDRRDATATPLARKAATTSPTITQVGAQRATPNRGKTSKKKSLKKDHTPATQLKKYFNGETE